MHDVQPHTRFDLHLHTTRSDGRYDAAEVLARCASGGLDVVALTDHDLPTDLTPGWHSLPERDIRLIAAAEISGMHDGREHHLLVYFPGAVPDGFRAFCMQQCRERAVRYDTIVAHLGVDLAPADPAGHRGERALTRHHLARALVAGGYVTSVREAFARFLGDGRPGVPPLSVSFVDAIRTARSLGGLTVWAHPPVTLLDTMLPALVAAGLHGLEAHRPPVTSADRRKLRAAAARHGLVLTGGSDWHGWGDDADLGLFRVHAREIDPFLSLLAALAAADSER